MKSKSLLSRGLSALFRLGPDPARSAAAPGGSSRPQLELLEDRMTPSAPGASAASGLFPIVEPVQVRMALPSPGPSQAAPVTVVSVGSYSLSMQQFENGMNLTLKNNDQGMMVINVQTAGSTGQSSDSGGITVSMVQSPAVAEGTGAPGSRYLLISILVPSSLAGPQVTLQSGPAPSDETFATFAPRTKPQTFPALGLVQNELFDVFAKDAQLVARGPDSKPVGMAEEQGPVEHSDESRRSTAPANAPLLGDAEQTLKKAEDSPTGQTDQQREEVFADPSFLPSSLVTYGMLETSGDKPQPQENWRLWLLAIPLALHADSVQRRSGAAKRSSIF